MSTLEDHESWFDKGIELYESKKLEDALDCFQGAINIKPDFIPAWIYKGMLLEQLNRWNEAIDSYEQAIQGNPNVADLWYNKGATFVNIQRYEDARACFNKVVEIEPNNAIAHIALNLTEATLQSIGSFHSHLMST